MLQINFLLKMNLSLIIKLMWNTLALLVCFVSSQDSVLICLQNGKVASFISFFKVFDSNFNILKVLRPLSLKIDMQYQETLFLVFPNYFLIQDFSF